MKKVEDFLVNIDKMAYYWRKYFKNIPYVYVEDDLKSAIALGLWEAFKVQHKYTYSIDFLVNLIIKRKVLEFLKKFNKYKKKIVDVYWENFDIPIDSEIEEIERKIDMESSWKIINKHLLVDEQILLQKLLEGKQNKEIAKELGISYKKLLIKIKDLRFRIRKIIHSIQL